MLEGSKLSEIADNTPIIVGVGQHVEREMSDTSPMTLAGLACKTALDDAGLSSHADAIDTIAVVRLFSDSAPFWACPFGRSDNPPESIARFIGASPTHRIYSDSGGSLPLQLLFEMATAIARGEKTLALITGAEGIGNQKHLQRNGLSPDWNEHYDEPMEDRGYGKTIVSRQEFMNGLHLPVNFYAIIENCRAANSGITLAEQARSMAKLFAPFSQVAETNPYSQFPKAYSEEDFAISKDNYAISTPYSKRLISQDAVNQGAALVVTSVGQAKAWGVDSSQWIFLHGFAEGLDHCLFQRPDPGQSAIMAEVFKQTLTTAQTDIDDIDLFDIYSCFPCAVASACDALGIQGDDPRGLTVTGGLPFFGGPGNNYSMHGLAEMTQQLRCQPGKKGLVTANGGMLSKHAAVVLSTEPALHLDWSNLSVPIADTDAFDMMPEALAPREGHIISYTLKYKRDAITDAVILGETADAERFVASTQAQDIITQFRNEPPFDRAVSVQQIEDDNNQPLNQFTLKE